MRLFPSSRFVACSLDDALIDVQQPFADAFERDVGEGGAAVNSSAGREHEVELLGEIVRGRSGDIAAVHSREPPWNVADVNCDNGDVARESLLHYVRRPLVRGRE